MIFEEKLAEFVHSLRVTKEYPNDKALKRVVEILEQTPTEVELRRQSDLISRISIDSVENWVTVEKISNFLKSVAK